MKCNIQYVGSTSTQFKVRFGSHKSAMKCNKVCETAVHYNASPHKMEDFKCIVIEQIRDEEQTDRKLLIREAYWTNQLRTLHPHGLKERSEQRNVGQINYVLTCFLKLF